ncbi:50S ribosomal protein L4 [bacterium]|nr:50S ribosomal protein L4 [bacterium]
MSIITICDRHGKKLESLSAIKLCDAAAGAADVFAQAIRVLRQGRRQGTVSCKGRSDVSYTNKKPWRQKGTGRARASSARSPLWRGGGVTFGPSPRVKKLSINAKQRKMAFRELFRYFLSRDGVRCIDVPVEGSEYATKWASSLLNDLGLRGKKVAVLMGSPDRGLFASFRNITGVRVIDFACPEIEALSNVNAWMFLKKDEAAFKTMVEKWN